MAPKLWVTMPAKNNMRQKRKPTKDTDQMKLIVKYAKPENDEERQFQVQTSVNLQSNQTHITINGIKYVVAFANSLTKGSKKENAIFNGTPVPVA
jgi:hypothetical protein